MKIYTKEDLNNKEISEAFYSVIELEALDSVSKIIEDVKNNKNKDGILLICTKYHLYFRQYIEICHKDWQIQCQLLLL